MSVQFKDAITICKTIMRNGYDAHIVNTQLQHEIIEQTNTQEIDLSTDIPEDELLKLFPSIKSDTSGNTLGTLEENGFIYRFYRMHFTDAAHPDVILTRLTPTILTRMHLIAPLPSSLVNGMSSLLPKEPNENHGFDDFSEGIVKLEGLPDETLRSDYNLALRALRYAANFDLKIDPNTWIAIIRASQRILDYVPVQKLMFEMRKVEAENLWKFIKLLFNTRLLHGFIPEIAALSCVMQTKNDTGVEETVLEHTIQCVKSYPEGEFHYDWLGTLSMLFHDVGKLYTAEFFQNRWVFYEHHRVGAEITRKILNRLRMRQDEIELICDLVKNHMRFEFMMTDKGIRKFKAQGNTARLIEIARANIVARDDNYTAFNHNNKYLARAEMPEQMVEPMLNGNEIMEVTGLSPGPHVGEIRHSLLKEQIAGTVNNRDEAVAYVKSYAKNVQ